MVLGGDSYFKGRGFEFQHRVLDGHFSHYIVELFIVCLKGTQNINEKEAGNDPFKNYS